MSIDRYNTSVQWRDDKIVVAMDSDTGEWLLDVLYAFGEHIAAGAPIHPLPAEANNRLGSLLAQLAEAIRHAGGSGASA